MFKYFYSFTPRLRFMVLSSKEGEGPGTQSHSRGYLTEQNSAEKVVRLPHMQSDALITLPLVKCVHSICSKGSPNAPPSLPPREGGAFRGALGANEQIE